MDQQGILITLFSLGFVVALIGLILVLTIYRQLRYRRQTFDVLPPSPVTPIPPTRETGTFKRTTTTSEFRRIPIREASPNQVVLSIQPTDITPQTERKAS